AKEPGIRSSRDVKGRRYQALLRPRWRCNLRSSVDVLAPFYRRPTICRQGQRPDAVRYFSVRRWVDSGGTTQGRSIVAFWSDRLTEIMDSRMLLLINRLGHVCSTNNQAQVSER